MPRPNNASQYRLAMTRAVSGLSLSTSQRAKLQAIERPVAVGGVKRGRQTRFDHRALVEIVARDIASRVSRRWPASSRRIGTVVAGFMSCNAASALGRHGCGSA